MGKQIFFKVISKQRRFCLNFHIIGNIGKTSCFSSKCGYLYVYQRDLQKILFWNADIFEDMRKKRFFQSDQNNFLFSKCWYFRLLGRHNIFQSDLKKTSFSSKCWNFLLYGWRESFWPQSNVVFAKMFILLKIWVKQLSFPRNVDIFGYMAEKMFFKEIYKKSFSGMLIFSEIWKKKHFFQSDLSKCWYFWTYGKKQFFQFDVKKVLYLWNFIFSEIFRFFQSDLKKVLFVKMLIGDIQN